MTDEPDRLDAGGRRIARESLQRRQRLGLPEVEDREPRVARERGEAIGITRPLHGDAQMLGDLPDLRHEEQVPDQVDDVRHGPGRSLRLPSDQATGQATGRPW